MLELEDALARILAALPAPRVETVSLDAASGRIVAETITSPIALPPFDNSAMDGYAVRADDVSSAKKENPVRLRSKGKVVAGEIFTGNVAAGECVRIFTGSPLPRGTDAVVMQEDTRVEAPEEITVLDSVKPWENVRFRGEDVKLGGKLVEMGEPVTAARVAALAAAGVTQVTVGREPLVALLATGTELKKAGDPLAPGQIYESNRSALSVLARRAGAVPKIFPIIVDALDETCAALEHAFAECDVVVTCGGVSVGEMDFVKPAFERLGGELQFWKVAIKPGRPFVFGRRDGKFLFGLPGNPVSAFVTFLLLVRPALLRLQGARGIALRSHPGVLAEPLSNSGGRRHFVRVTTDTLGRVRSSGIQASHILSSLASANGLVDVPPKTELSEGTNVEVLRWD